MRGKGTNKQDRNLTANALKQGEHSTDTTRHTDALLTWSFLC